MQDICSALLPQPGDRHSAQIDNLGLLPQELVHDNPRCGSCSRGPSKSAWERGLVALQALRDGAIQTLHGFYLREPDLLPEPELLFFERLRVVERPRPLLLLRLPRRD